MIALRQRPLRLLTHTMPGLTSYHDAQVLQNGVYKALKDRRHEESSASMAGILLFLEHKAVYTLGKRQDMADYSRTTDLRGIDIVRTDRGGLTTYHGPGQLVVYPLLNLQLLKVLHSIDSGFHDLTQSSLESGIMCRY